MCGRKPNKLDVLDLGDASVSVMFWGVLHTVPPYPCGCFKDL